MKVRIFLIVCLTFLFGAPVQADEQVVPSIDGPQERADRPDRVPLSNFITNNKLVENSVDIKNAFETADKDIQLIKYNEDGTISSVQYADGTTALYSQEYDGEGNLSVCTVESDGVEIIFSSEEKIASLKSAETKNSQPGENKNIVVYCPAKKQDLDKIARKPIKFDFGKIEKAVSEASEFRKKAMEEYKKKTSAYYYKVEKELKNILKALGPKDAKIEKYARELARKDTFDEKRRGIIDEAVIYIYSVAKKDSKNEVVNEFLVPERDLREKILTHELEIYEGRVETALARINKIIDELINSKLALYLDLQKDKIDAVISLPELADKE